jgi:hypothetical protein
MGVVVLDERGLRLQVNRSRAQIHPAFDLRLQVVGVGFGIAKHSPAGFEIVEEHVIPQSGGWDRGANADVAIGYPEFRVDGVVPADLVNRWPVLFLEVRMRDRQYHGGRVVYGEPGQVMRLYAHGSDEIFRGLLAGKPWQ